MISLSTIDLKTASGSGELDLDGSNLSSLSAAQTALTKIDTAINQVNTYTGKIGAAQNRVDYSISNLKTSIQNFSAAESVIRDVDMAEEMTKFSKNQILSQAGTAMLAQANQLGQGVLTLLRG
jgi:flagellin